MPRILTPFWLSAFCLLFAFGCENELSTDKKKDPTSSIPKNVYLTETLEKMQGIWIFSENENRTIRIKKNVFREKRPGDPEEVMEIEAYENCPSYCSDQNQNVSMMSCFILKINNTAECYALYKVTEEEMQFTSMAGKPKVQVFKKKK